MGRMIGAVVAGYVTMIVFVMATFSGAFLVLGTGGAFQPGSFQVSGTWLVVSSLLSIAAALAGGLVCAAIAQGSPAPYALAALILILGLAMAVPVVMAADEPLPPRAGDLSNFEAMGQARQPGWVAVANPFIGAIGVLLGASLLRRRSLPA